jgi:hypothetical protein
MRSQSIFVFVVLFGFIAFGCEQRASNAQDAITQSKTKTTVEAQVDYLVSQANAFFNSKNFDEAIATAQYVLSNLDKDSDKAKSIIEMAKAELQKLAQQKVEDLKQDASKAVDGMKQKMGALGK